MSRHPKFLEAIELFNQRKFWESHEALEVPWREDRTPGREFYQGIIHCAAALHHARLATLRREGRHGQKPATPAQVLRHLEGAKGQWEKAQSRLQRFRPRHAGLDVGGFLDAMGRVLEGIEDGRVNYSEEQAPRIVLVD